MLQMPFRSANEEEELRYISHLTADGAAWDWDDAVFVADPATAASPAGTSAESPASRADTGAAAAGVDGGAGGEGEDPDAERDSTAPRP